jgi:hypothetical protein
MVSVLLTALATIRYAFRLDYAGLKMKKGAIPQ